MSTVSPLFERLVNDRADLFAELQPELTKPDTDIRSLKDKLMFNDDFNEVVTHLAINAMRGFVAEKRGVEAVQVKSFDLAEAVALTTLSSRWTLGLQMAIRLPGEHWDPTFVSADAVAFAHDDIIAEGAALAKELN